MTQKTRMTKPQDKAVAVADVPNDAVADWEAAGWTADKSTKSTKDPNHKASKED